MPKRLRVYLDTSIFSFAISSQDVKEEKEITLQFLEKVKNGIFAAHVSGVVFEEIRKAPQKKQDDLLKLMGQFEIEPLLRTDEADVLADRYIAEKVIPLKHRDDALHIAIATVHNLDVIVSWNFEHIVKLKTRREVRGINTLMGYRSIEICSPQEMI